MAGKNWLDEKVGSLTVISRLPNDDNGHSIWKCKCECGKVVPVKGYNLTRNTKSCGCKRRRDSKLHKNWRGYGDIHGKMWSAIKRRAARFSGRHMEFTITIQYIWELFLSQKGRCALTNMPIVFAKTWAEVESRGTTASLDRIDSSQGYIPGNVQWVHKDVNHMKWDYKEDYFIEICCQIAYHKRGYRDI